MDYTYIITHLQFSLMQVNFEMKLYYPFIPEIIIQLNSH